MDYLKQLSKFLQIYKKNLFFDIFHVKNMQQFVVTSVISWIKKLSKTRTRLRNNSNEVFQTM